MPILMLYITTVKFYRYQFIPEGEVALTRHMKQTNGENDGQGDSYIPAKLCLQGYYKTEGKLI